MLHRGQNERKINLIKVKLGGKIHQHCVISQPIKLTKEIKERMLYVIEPVGCRVAIDEFASFMSVQIENKKIRFLGEFSKC